MANYYFDGQIPNYRSDDLTKSITIIPQSNILQISDTSINKVLNINSQQLSNNSGQSLLFSDIYTTVAKTDAIVYPAVNPTTLTVRDKIIINDVIGNETVLTPIELCISKRPEPFHQRRYSNSLM